MIGTVYGQDFVYPSINGKGKDAVSFVPAGWRIMDSACGNLHKHDRADVAMVIQTIDTVKMAGEGGDSLRTQPRILLVLFQKPGDTLFHLAVQNNSFILPHDKENMDDPFDGLGIRNGSLFIKFRLFYTMGDWHITNASYRFRYQGGRFVLTHADKSTLHRATGDREEYHYDFLFRKRTRCISNENTGRQKTSIKVLPTKSLKTLQRFVIPFSWQVEKGVYL